MAAMKRCEIFSAGTAGTLCMLKIIVESLD
jgi:hypothetical protein